jgi:hypothetical protein
MLMSKRHDRLARALVISGLIGGLFSGCKEEFADDKFGVLDLASFYDGGTQTDPAAGVPADIFAEDGYIEGQISEFYDFGLVPAIINSKGMPVGVRVQPMYFFFDSSGFPLFSRPVPEQRGGTDWMKGGKGVLDPNPKDFCKVPGADPAACAAANDTERKLSYALRRRDFVVDKNRGVADYQRPLVDVVPGNDDPPRQQYTGMWEMIEVTVPDDYEPDAIKQVSTLQKALASGKFSQRSNGRVINCPIVDERTNVARGITARGIFHPRIELWYRRQLAFCFLANGWETLGNPSGELYFAKQDEARFDTFDVSHVKVGAGTELAVDVGKAYQPTTFGVDENTGLPKVVNRVSNNTLVSERPKRGRTDAPGYTPVRWVFDVPAPFDYKRGTWKSVSDIDPARARGNPVQVKNISVRGVAVACSFQRVAGDDFPPGSGQQRCGRNVRVDPGPPIVDATGDPVCNAETRPGESPLECNPETCFCDAPFVGYGQACGPGIAQCSPTPDKFAPDGYQCFPPWGGFCQRGCDPAKPNTRSEENAGKEIAQQVDTRCGEVPGLVCFGGLRTCIKFCDQNIKDPKQCSAVVPVGDESRETQEGQTCQDFGLAVCAWPDTWTPQPFSVPQ